MWKGESSIDCVGSNITIKGIEGEGGVGGRGETIHLRMSQSDSNLDHFKDSFHS